MRYGRKGVVVYYVVGKGFVLGRAMSDYHEVW